LYGAHREAESNTPVYLILCPFPSPLAPSIGKLIAAREEKRRERKRGKGREKKKKRKERKRRNDAGATWYLEASGSR